MRAHDDAVSDALLSSLIEPPPLLLSRRLLRFCDQNSCFFLKYPFLEVGLSDEGCPVPSWFSSEVRGLESDKDLNVELLFLLQLLALEFDPKGLLGVFPT